MYYITTEEVEEDMPRDQEGRVGFAKPEDAGRYAAECIEAGATTATIERSHAQPAFADWADYLARRWSY